MHAIPEFVRELISAVNGINLPGLGALLLIVALVVVWKR